MGFIRKFITKLYNMSSISEVNPIDEHEQRFIDVVIELLETQPESFSAMWCLNGQLEKSIYYEKKRILIMVESGQITRPIEPKMTDLQKERIRKLVKPIVKRDSDYIIDKMLN